LGERISAGPGQRRALARRVGVNFLRGIEQVETFGALALRLSVAKVHVDAKSAAIDLRCPELDQFDQLRFETDLIDYLLQSHHGWQDRLAGAANRFFKRDSR
jgi:hypothetical protein